MDIKEAIRAIQVEAQKELGSDIPKRIWGIIEREVGNLNDYTEGEPDGEEPYLDGYRQVTRSYVEVLKIAKNSDNAKSSNSSNRKINQPQKRYRKCFERRFYLVNFVLDSSYKRGTRVDWKRTTGAWNKVHLSDQMNASTLRVEYQRSINDTTLILQAYIYQCYEILNKLQQKDDTTLDDAANKNPLGHTLASPVDQQIRINTQPSISALTETVRKTSIFKNIHAKYPYIAAYLESEFKVIANMGSLKLIPKGNQRVNRS